MKIAIAGTGYVGLSLAILLSQNNEVWAYDIDGQKLNLINDHISPIKDLEIEDYLKHKKLNLLTTTDYKKAFVDADYIIIATPHQLRRPKKSFRYIKRRSNHRKNCLNGPPKHHRRHKIYHTSRIHRRSQEKI